MKIRSYILVATSIFVSLALNPLESRAAESRNIPDYLLGEKFKPEGDIILEVGALPAPPPSRRQIIDADKGEACLQCHHMSYPVAPQKPEKEGEKPLSSIQVTPGGG
jgi:hypothetical protein